MFMAAFRDMLRVIVPDTLLLRGASIGRSSNVRL